MKKINLMVLNKITILLCFVLITFSFLGQVKTDDILGKWLTEKNEAVVQIFKTNDGKYAGKIIWLKEPLDEKGNPKTDTKNPKPELRNRTILNLVFMGGFEFNNKEKEWENGIIYDAETGNTYKARIYLSDKNTLQLRGYIGSPIFGRTTTWTRKYDK
jgi:uncharacterized protein (DUF2147 family)